MEASAAPVPKAVKPVRNGEATRQRGRRSDDQALRQVLEAMRAARDGDFSVRLPEGKGVTGEIAATFNELVERNAGLTEEIGRVSRIIGREGQLTERASLEFSGGDWSSQVESVNSLIEDLARPTTEVGRVIEAVAEGDLSQTMALEIEGQPVKGEFLRIGTTVNTMVDQLSSFAAEVTRVAKEVGTDGKLGGQAKVEGVSGTWRGLTDNVNFMADNLTGQVRNIAQVTTAVANGDLSQKITADAKGEILELKSTINTMVDQLSSFAAEVTRVAREVGTDGKLGGQATVEGVSGTWRGLTESVNFMAGNLTSQVRNIAQVTTAVAEGDLTQRITVDAKGEVAQLADTINSMTDTLRTFADQVTGVAREVGTEGILGGQAEVPGVAGTWRDLTESVNSMAGNLTSQVRDIAEVTTAVANGDLSQKITADAKGEILELKNTINTMVDQLSSFADEVTRVAKEVGTEGELGGQAEVKGVSGTWRDLTENVNFMAGNLTTQVRNIAQVATAVANGDLSQKITADAKGEILELKSTVNTMVDQLSSFADEVTRVAKEVGTDGKLGVQAEVEGVSGTWRGLTENVNFMADNLTGQVRNIAQVTTAVANGDLSQKITAEAKGEILELKNTINTMVDQLSSFAAEVTRVAREVGTDGKLGGQAKVEGVSGTWRGLTENVNFMADNLTGQVRNIAQVTTAVANGDLSQKITADAKGEILELKDTINTMVDQLSSFADEVTRVAKEVGTDGKLGGQARVEGVSGTWRGLTDNVNFMADNLTGQVRNIAQVATAVAEGDLSQKITADAKGEILELKSTINTMVDQLSSFAAEVTRVAREVGTEGKLGGQATVEGVSGTWRGLTDSVNQLAGNLTTQVRAIAEVSTAVTQGDLTREIAVEAQGELDALKDNINQMIANLRDTTQENAEQDWLKTNLARISGSMQGQRDLEAVSQLIMSELTPVVSAHHGAFFMAESDNGDEPTLKLIASYGYKERKNVGNRFSLGEGLVGQAALERKAILLTEAPSDYIKISSGLGEAAPVNVIVMPVVFEGQLLGVIELASFRHFSQVNQTFLDQLVETIGVVLNTIIANMRTEELLEQSQSLAHELQSQSEELQSQQDELKRSNSELEEQAQSLKASEELLQTQQDELKQTNEELEEKASQLAEQNAEIEVKNREIETARVGLEEKARELSIGSKYKSEFLANMSHELRTPLNSLLILAKLLADNPQGNLTAKQMEFATTIHGAGADLLTLINDILDLSKVEAGKMDVDPREVDLDEVRSYVERSFSPVAGQKGLGLEIEVDPAVEGMVTDQHRLQQILKNLLSNAFKFTDNGRVALDVAPAPEGTLFAERTLNQSDRVIAFTVTDTGIGMAEDKLKLIFEAFQQADGTTSRRFGGTGLGLSISRELARLLGGEIRVSSTVAEGSTFVLYLPERYVGDDGVAVEDGALAAPGPSAAAVLDAPLPWNAGGAGTGTLPRPTVAEVDDDRDDIEPGDRVVLIIEDDPGFARTVLETAHAGGFKALIALRGDTGLTMARQYLPPTIVLDLGLPVTDGMDVLSELKRHPDTRDIAVHVVSGSDRRHEALEAGAFSYSEKPVGAEALEAAFAGMAVAAEPAVGRMLIVEDDERQRESVVELLEEGHGVEALAVASSEEAFEALEADRFDCLVLDLGLPEATGFELLDRLKGDERFAGLPVIVYTGREITREEETELKRYADAIVVKHAGSPERLLAETRAFLPRPGADTELAVPEPVVRPVGDQRVLEGKKVLVVDDDLRNVFALSSALEAEGVDVLFAENGRKGIEALEGAPDVDLILMDVMMPEMDGYETTRAIRGMRGFEALPIISLTAKAMKGDREKSIESGASDYITKPIDPDQLLSLLRVWLQA